VDGFRGFSVFGIIVHSVGGAFLVIFWAWAVLDCISTDSILVRNLPKMTWLFLVLFIPTIGAVAWLLLGRPEHAGMSLGGQRSWLYETRPEPSGGASRPAPRGIEDDPNWRANTARSAPAGQDTEESLAIRERKLLEREAELAKREAELTDEARDPDDES